MKKLIIDGSRKLSGTINISGAKNSAVALLPAAILSDQISTITNIPHVSDIDNLIEILELIGAKINKYDDTIEINASNIKNQEIKEEMCNKLRASYYFMGALLGKFKKVEIYFPGGCPLGQRPIDMHIKGFKALGATVNIEDNKYIIEAKELIGSKIVFEKKSVGATINIMLAAVKAKGQTVIVNAAKEPEIINLADFLNSMGAKIIGAGTDEITIEGVEILNNGLVKVIPDRIEAGTYLIAGALMGQDLTIQPVIKDHLQALVEKLEEAGVTLVFDNESCHISKQENLNPISVTTSPFPGFPTDLQQPIMILLTQCNGSSIIEETIYDRFKQVGYLNSMGAKITVKTPKAYIEGKTPLVGKEVIATDLRAGAALVIAALLAEGTTIINDVEHILRGYDKIIEKLTKVGAKIRLEQI